MPVSRSLSSLLAGVWEIVVRQTGTTNPRIKIALLRNYHKSVSLGETPQVACPFPCALKTDRVFRLSMKKNKSFQSLLLFIFLCQVWRGSSSVDWSLLQLWSVSLSSRYHFKVPKSVESSNKKCVAVIRRIPDQHLTTSTVVGGKHGRVRSVSSMLHSL